MRHKSEDRIKFIDLKYPWWRTELLQNIAVLSDSEFQKSYWNKNIAIPYRWTLDGILEFLFDDFDIQDAQKKIGYSLLSTDEAKILQEMDKILTDIYDDLKTDNNPSLYLNHKRWPEVINIAASVISLFLNIPFDDLDVIRKYRTDCERQ